MHYHITPRPRDTYIYPPLVRASVLDANRYTRSTPQALLVVVQFRDRAALRVFSTSLVNAKLSSPFFFFFFLSFRSLFFFHFTFFSFLFVHSFIHSFVHISVYLLYIHLFVCLFIYLFTFFCFPLSPKNHCEASVAFSPTRHRVAANSLRVHLRLFRVYSRKNVQERNVTSGKEIASENAAETSAQSLGSGPRRNVHAHR